MDNVKREKQKNKYLNEQFFIILEDYVREYKIAKSHQAINEYTERLNSTESAYQNLEKNIFLQKNHLQKLNLQMNARILTQSKDIDKYRQEVNLLKKKANYLNPIQNSAEGLFEEEKQLYTLIHYEIVALAIGIFVASGLTYATFRKT